jgi:hypothetical protein
MVHELNTSPGVDVFHAGLRTLVIPASEMLRTKQEEEPVLSVQKGHKGIS